MRHIFNSIASFVHRKTRSPGILWLRRKLHQFVAVFYQHRKQIIAGVFVVAICGVYLGVSGTVWAKDALPAELQKSGWWSNLNPVLLLLRGLNAVLEICVGLAGKMATLLISFLMNIAQYNDFLSSTAVANGWVVTRDIANMFFIVILLVIAFGTILGSGDYNTKMIGKLLVMAVVINFSRTIIGIMIDASQIIMLTFVNGFSAAGAGNFINAFGVAKVLQYQSDFAGDANVTGLGILASALIMGLVLMLVACSVLLTIVGTLLFRIAYLWLLIVLSPIAWLMSTFPAGKKYYTQWWDQFRDQLVVGPAMAFFLWLSLTAVGSGLAWNQVIVKGGELAKVELGVTQLLTSESILSFIITIVLLMASVQMAQKLAGSASGYGTFMKQWASGIARGKKLGVGALKTADLAQAQVTGLELTKIPDYVKTGLTNRKKLLETKAGEMRLRRAAQLRKVPLYGGLASALWAPDVAIEKFATGGWSGIASRRFENVGGSSVYGKMQAWNTGRLKKKVEKIEKDIDTKRSSYDDAVEIHNTNLGLEQEFKTMTDVKDRAVSQGSDAMDKDDFDRAKKLGLLSEQYKKWSFETYKKRSKEVNDDIAKEYDKKNQNQFEGLDEKIAESGKAMREAQDAFALESKPLQEELLKTQATQAAYDRFYMGSDVGIRQRLDRQRFAASAEAEKKLDPSATKEELVVEFTRAMAMKDRGMMDAVMKRLAKAGNIEALFSVFGIRGTGGIGSMKQLETVLKGEGGFDDGYAKRILNRVSELEFQAGSYDNANLIKVDKVTGDVTWRNPTDSAAITLQRTLSKPSEKVLETISIKTLWTTGPDGVEKFGPNSIGILDLINENPKALKNRVETGKVETDLILRLRPYYEELRKEGIFTDETIKILESTELPKDPRKTYKKMSDAQNHIKEMRDKGFISLDKNKE